MCVFLGQVMITLAAFFLEEVLSGGGMSTGINGKLKIMNDSGEQRLINYLFSSYNPRLRPVLRTSDVVTVTFGISLHQIIDVDEKNQLLQTSIWVRQVWNNPFLTWNESEFGGIKSINVKSSQVWTPDIYLYNNKLPPQLSSALSANNEREGGMDQFSTQIVLNSTGWSKWLAPAILSSACKMDVKYFPFDAQSCELKFGSWTYDGFRVNIVQEAVFADTKKFVSNGEWQLIAFPAKRNEMFYVCCPEPYPDVTFTLQIQRLALFYYVNLIIPCLLITVLTVTAFYLPPESGERITLVITNLLAMIVFMLLVADIMPSTSEVIPVISIYFSNTIFEVSLALLGTCFILKCHFHDPAASDLPLWVRHVVFNWIAKILRFKIHTKRRPSVPNLTNRETATSLGNEATEVILNNNPGVKDPQRQRTVDGSFLPSNGINHSLMKQLSYSNLVNGNYKSGPTLPRQGDLGSISRLNVTQQSEDRCIAASIGTLTSNDERGQQYNCDPSYGEESRALSNEDRRVEELIKLQELLLEQVKILTKVVAQNEQLQAKKYEWNMVASILDKAFRIAFLFIFFLSTMTIFYIARS